jgi:hypothetical protein
MCRRTAVIVLLVLWVTFARAEDFSPPNHIKEPQLRVELLSRDEADQKARFALVAWLNVDGTGMTVIGADLSSEHLAEYVKSLESVYGSPTRK